jgi:hypothetical protein
MHMLDPLNQALILGASGRSRPTAPGVEPGSTNPMQPAHHSDRVRGLGVLDEGEDVALRVEANSMAFF